MKVWVDWSHEDSFYIYYSEEQGLNEYDIPATLLNRLEDATESLRYIVEEIQQFMNIQDRDRYDDRYQSVEKIR